jgi:hypothetical protein
MSLLIDNFNHISYTAGKKRLYYEYAYDTVNMCHLIVRCDAQMQGGVDITGDVTIDGNLDVTGLITGTVAGNVNYRVSYNTADFLIPDTLATSYEVYQVDTSSNPVTVTLPTIASLDGLKKRNFYIVDVGGALRENPLTIVTTGGDTVAGETSVSLTVDFTGVHLMSNANVAPGAAGKWLIT